jgi:hypothetical protein
MTAPTLAPSAYPTTVEDLIPAARDLADQLGGIPSRNRLMKEFKVGAPKAIAIREALLTEATDRMDRQDTVTYAAIRGRNLDPTNTTGWVASGDPAAPTTTAAPAPATELTESDDSTEMIPAADTPVQIPQGAPVGHPDSKIHTPAPAGTLRTAQVVRRPVTWPVLILCLPAFVAIWSGWVGLGELAGFGLVNPLPGIADHITINTAITLPIGVETYAAYALWVWLSGRAPRGAREFAKWSAIGSLIFGAAGQVAYHVMIAAGVTVAPWLITAAVACLPVAVLGMGAALAHLLHTTDE